MLSLRRYASPLVGFIKQDNIFIVVVFPAPFPPSRANNSPCLIVKLRLSTATVFSYFFVRFSIVIAFISYPSFHRLD